MKKKQHIAVLLMAAGESKRMKSIKQLMPWKDSNFLLDMIKKTQKTKASSVHVVLGSNAALIIDSCKLKNLGIDIIENIHWSKGLGNSIACGVKTLQEQQFDYDGILICLADQPLLTTDFLNSLIGEFEKDPSKIIGTNYGKKIGVPALFPKLLFKELSQLQGDSGAKQILGNIDERLVSIKANNEVIDIDTKEEYNRLIKQTTNTHKL